MQHPKLRLGILSDPYYSARLRSTAPRAEWVELASPREFFDGAKPGLDAFLFTAEAGSAWTLLYPRFAVVAPRPGLVALPLVYAVARGDQQLLDFLNAWIALKQKDGTRERSRSLLGGSPLSGSHRIGAPQRGASEPGVLAVPWTQPEIA